MSVTINKNAGGKVKKAKGGMGRKSGVLTGLVMVSLGLVAGYHGFNLASSGEKSQAGKITTSALHTQPRAKTGRKDPIANLIDQAGDLEKLARPIKNTPVKTAYDKTQNPAPLVNRALKVDFIVEEGEPVAASEAAGEEAVKVESVAAREENTMPEAAAEGDEAGLWLNRAISSQPGAEPAPEAAAEMAKSVKPAMKMAAGKLPLLDAADVALFAADMPLPAGLGRAMQGANSVPAHGSPSPMRPRLYETGKTFGGLAEREFQRRERRCMVTALYFEARSEPIDGQIAVGQVIMNRVKSPDYPDTICGVVYQGSHRRTGCQFSFTCDGKPDKPRNKKLWERTKRIADEVLRGKVHLRTIGNATHYHADYVSPRWRHKMARLTKIGRHIFYKSPNISVTASFQRYANGKRG